MTPTSRTRPDAAGPTRGLRVLVIDDDEQLGSAPAAQLESWGSRALRMTVPDDAAVREALATGGGDRPTPCSPARRARSMA